MAVNPPKSYCHTNTVRDKCMAVSPPKPYCQVYLSYLWFSNVCHFAFFCSEIWLKELSVMLSRMLSNNVKGRIVSKRIYTCTCIEVTAFRKLQVVFMAVAIFFTERHLLVEKLNRPQESTRKEN